MDEHLAVESCFQLSAAEHALVAAYGPQHVSECAGGGLLAEDHTTCREMHLHGGAEASRRGPGSLQASRQAQATGGRS